MNRETLEQLTREWRRNVIGRNLFFAFGVGWLTTACMILISGYRRTWWGLVLFAAVFVFRLVVSRPWRIDAVRVARHLDRTYPEMEESGVLFLKPPDSLTLLERLQRNRVGASVDARASGQRTLGGFGMPRRFLGAMYFCGAAMGLAILASVWVRVRPARPEDARTPDKPAVGKQASLLPPAALAWPRITGGGLLVTPPAYTARPPRRVEGFQADVEEGATVAWTVALDRPVREARLVFGDGPAGSLALEVRPADTGVRLSGTRRITETGLYHLAATLPDGTVWNPPELYALKVIKDHPPAVRIVQPPQARTEVAPAVPPAASPRAEVEIEASDDYGIADIRIIATVAKGSGEAVKFRELPLAFESDTTLPDGVTRRFTRTLDLGALGLEPGDELYFFVQAYDNRQPTGNRTRSETRFVTLRGPQEKATTTGQGLTGVNLVPQYFRSERQIIIDTEKLIADRAAISGQEFRERASSLGIDQQLLRLRYGQLLGEELEGGKSDHSEVNLDPLQRTAPAQAVGPRAAASVTQRFLQEHEEQDREGGTSEQRETGMRPDHPEKPLPAGEVVAPFVDQHDSQDKSTFFDGGTKGTMRDALAAMWDAEKFLRTIRPEEALAPEHRALEILKDLQQSARAYVQHVGFEAPPIKVNERRLAGDTSDVPPRGSVADVLTPGDPAAQAVRDAVGVIPFAPKAVVGSEALAALRRVEPALTAAATRQPDVFLPGLQILRRLAAENGRAGSDPEEYSRLRRALLRLLPAARPLPDRGVESDPALEGSYFRALQVSANLEGNMP